MDEDRKQELLTQLMDAVTTKMEQLGVSKLLLTPDKPDVHDGNADYEELRDELDVILATYAVIDKVDTQPTILELAFRDRLIELGEDEYVKYHEQQYNQR